MRKIQYLCPKCSNVDPTKDRITKKHSPYAGAIIIKTEFSEIPCSACNARQPQEEIGDHNILY